MQNNQTLLNKLNSRIFYVAPSKIHGVGLFAITNIQPNTLIYSIDLSKWEYIKKTTILNRDLLPYLEKYYYYNKKINSFYIDTEFNHCFTHYINYSFDSSNIKYSKGQYISKTLILKEEEILINPKENNYNPNFPAQ